MIESTASPPPSRLRHPPSLSYGGIKHPRRKQRGIKYCYIITQSILRRKRRGIQPEWIKRLRRAGPSPVPVRLGGSSREGELLQRPAQVCPNCRANSAATIRLRIQLRRINGRRGALRLALRVNCDPALVPGQEMNSAQRDKLPPRESTPHLPPPAWGRIKGGGRLWRTLCSAQPFSQADRLISRDTPVCEIS